MTSISLDNHIPNSVCEPISGTKPQTIFQACALPRFESEKRCLTAKVVVLTVLFPLGLAYLAWKVTAWAIGKIVALGLKYVILHSIMLYRNLDLKPYDKEIEASLKLSRIQALTSDNCLLQGVIAWNNKEDKKTFEAWDGTDKLKLKNQKFVLYVGANAECYQIFFPQALQQAQEFKANILRFNYREVADSNGVASCATDLVTDTHTMYEYLIRHLGIPKENILVYGRSLGGGIAAQMGAIDNINGIVLESSFSSISGCVGGRVESWVKGDRGPKDFFAKAEKTKRSEDVSLTRRVWARRAGSVAAFFAYQLLQACNWEIDTLEALMTLQAKKATVILATAPLDSIIREGGSVYKAWKRSLDGYVKIDPVNPVEEQFKKNELLKQSIFNIKFPSIGHNEPLHNNGFEYFMLTKSIQDFFRR